MQNILRIKDLCVSYNESHIIRNLNLNLEKGEKIILCGPNGSGKTTLLKCILGLLKQNSGDIESKAKCISYCKQDLSEKSFPISCEEVVCMGLKDTKNGKLKKAMETTKTYEFAKRSFFSLSGGERQRVSLSRCLYREADLILLDEPSSFLDEESKKTIQQVLKNMDEKTSVIAVSHDEEFIKNLNWPVLNIKELQK